VRDGAGFHAGRRAVQRPPALRRSGHRRLGDDAAGTLAGRIAVKDASRRRSEGAHEAALDFVQALIAVGARRARQPEPAAERELV
jgi:hypothetical protein